MPAAGRRIHILTFSCVRENSCITFDMRLPCFEILKTYQKAGSLRATTNRAPNEPVWPVCAQGCIFWGENGTTQVLVIKSQKTT